MWGLVVMGVVLIVTFSKAHKNPDPMLAVEANQSAELPTLFYLPQFKLVDQDGHAFTDAQLRGKPFVASFVFTHCAGPCPMMLGKMSAMQRNVTNPNIKLVTFTVDPERDTPAVLKAKAKELGADEGRWVFLTGDKDSVHQLLKDMLMPTPSPEDDPLMHATQFYLFDAEGKCRGRYTSKDDEEMKRLAKDAEIFAGQLPSPQKVSAEKMPADQPAMDNASSNNTFLKTISPQNISPQNISPQVASPTSSSPGNPS